MSDTCTEILAGAEAASEKPAFSLLSEEKLTEIYAAMIKLRALAERVGASSGKEAALAGALIDCRSGDELASTDPGALAGFFQGVSLAELAAWRAVSAPSDEMGAERIADAAWERCKRRKQEIVFALLPQGWESIPAWTQLVATVRIHRLPVIFISFPAEDFQGATASKPGFPVIPVDAQDAPAVYRVASESIARARNGCWPTLIECVTISADKESDPLQRMELYLRAKGFFDELFARKVRDEFKQKLKQAGI